MTINRCKQWHADSRQQFSHVFGNKLCPSRKPGARSCNQGALMPQQRACSGSGAVILYQAWEAGNVLPCCKEIKGRPLQTNGLLVVFNRIILSKKSKVWYRCALMQSWCSCDCVGHATTYTTGTRVELRLPYSSLFSLPSLLLSFCSSK